MELIDSHTHLYLKEFDNDRDEVIRNAVSRGVTRMFLPNISSHTVRPMLTMAETYPAHCFPMIGLHPGSVTPAFENELENIHSWIDKGTFYAIGETGMDLYWDKTYRDEQEKAFTAQVRWAVEYDLPLVIHSRNAFDEIMAVLEREKRPGLRGVFHSFTGTAEQAMRVIGLGFLLGINGIVTYRNSGLEEVIRKTGLTPVVLETDAPYLTPVPYRGKRNESIYLVHTAVHISRLLDIEPDEVARVTTGNALRLFDIKN